MPTHVELLDRALAAVKLRAIDEAILQYHQGPFTTDEAFKIINNILNKSEITL